MLKGGHDYHRRYYQDAVSASQSVFLDITDHMRLRTVTEYAILRLQLTLSISTSANPNIATITALA